MSGFNLAGIELSDTVKSLLEELDRPATADLPSDLPAPGEPQGDLGAGGDDVAMTRRALALGRVLRLERRANS